ncbi:biotin-dependent carboxyltransferase family protein [Psychromarinibacter sp. C21-152]|uniref:Biotin-dependent carboxyltransferase family protein n=1 Tax=Psychromarinibacter sediminicola TaxID=3033385 RepID=A0AAE3T9G9_9RHOB|nr:biotin-dependent carboxyltransferase family protein [Psychromarinibacter sediminicola]MDF0601014.1 biotin-dependent carboxyltransferase family protein [Psychromarinibacter sediminicola]
MSATLTIHSAGPGLTVQDTGRPGHLGQGLSRGGAADPLALAEGAALLGQPPDTAAVEMAGMGGVVSADTDIRIALTGAPMQATLNGERLTWNASHTLPAGARLAIGGARQGTYGYLHLGGGIATEPVLGARSAHLAAGLGRALAEGDTLPLGPDHAGETGQTLDIADRFSGGTVRVIPSMQTDRFAPDDLKRFEDTEFTRDPRGNRMGVKMRFDGAPFAAQDQLHILSEIIVPGDIQATGDGAPFVLLSECQTTGGYPRIATVIPPDLPRVAQARAGDTIRFAFVTRDEALAALRDHANRLAQLPKSTRPLVRNPHDIPDLLGYQLIGGVTTGREEP